MNRRKFWNSSRVPLGSSAYVDASEKMQEMVQIILGEERHFILKVLGCPAGSDHNDR